MKFDPSPTGEAGRFVLHLPPSLFRDPAFLEEARRTYPGVLIVEQQMLPTGSDED